MTSVNPRTLDQAFATFLSDAGGNLEASPDTGFRVLIDFYANVRADGCDLDADQDMLLFQWGTYDWGEGEHFEIDLVRQVMMPDEEDDDAIWQLHLTYRYRASAEFALLGSGNRWCPSPSEASHFAGFVLSSLPVGQGIAVGGARPMITFECAG
jgi:hypothetical protein